MMRHNFCKRLLIVMALTLFSGSALAQSLTANLDRSTVTTAETVNLSLTMEGAANSQAEPNWAPLRSNFKILANSSRTMMNLINGKSSMQTVWTAVLMPLRAGVIKIPPIHVGKLQSQALTLTVAKMSGAAASNNRSSNKAAEVYLEASVNTKQPFVQQQVVYTVKVFSREQMGNAFLTPPTVGNARLQQMGQELNYRAVKNGKQYQVVEVRYLLLPQSAGEYEINPAVFNAVVPMPGRTSMSANPFFALSGRTLRLVAPEVSINVRQQPAAFTGQWWLPAKSVSIQSSWSPNPPKFEVGTPITRTLTIRAIGLSGKQLPDLPVPQLNNANVYPDQPMSKTEMRNGELIGLHQLKLAIVPTKAGKLILPEVKVHWWNTKTDAPATATLPAQTIDVLPAPAGAAVPVAPVAPVVNAPAVQPQPIMIKSTSSWPWIIAAVFFLLWLATLFLWWRKKPAKVDVHEELGTQASVREARNALEKACGANDAANAKAALIDWAKTQWPETSIINLGDVSKQISDTKFNVAIDSLNAVFYAKQAVSWNGANFWQLFCEHEKQVKPEQMIRQKQDLPPLHLN